MTGYISTASLRKQLVPHVQAALNKLYGPTNVKFMSNKVSANSLAREVYAYYAGPSAKSVPADSDAFKQDFIDDGTYCVEGNCVTALDQTIREMIKDGLIGFNLPQTSFQEARIAG